MRPWRCSDCVWCVATGPTCRSSSTWSGPASGGTSPTSSRTASADLHDAQPGPTAALVLDWSRDENLWIRRTAILSQLGRRDRVDPEVLTGTIEPNLADREFFIRKAIGWALREYARVAPDWVRAYVADHDLSPLSRREALKHL